MSSDLLFPILPKLGKESINHDTQKVEKVEKSAVLKSLAEQQEQVDEDASNSNRQDTSANENSDKENQTESTNRPGDKLPENKKGKGPKHLDIYV